MAYRNRYRSSEDVWNRDLFHSDEEDTGRSNYRTSHMDYHPGYSGRSKIYDDRGYESNYRNDNDRYDTNYPGRWNTGMERDEEYSSKYRDYDNNDRGMSDYFYGGDRRTFYDDQYDRNSRDYYDNRERRDGRNWWDKTKDEVSSWFGDDDAERRRDRDNRVNHRGKGPKGYQRSDERIKEDVNDRLSEDDRVDASDIEVEVNSCEVILKGTVSSREEKRRAEDVVDSVSGVRNVENRLKVSQEALMNRYTGTTDRAGGIGTSSGTTSEVIRDVRKAKGR